MGEKDVKTKEFLSDNERFADLFNYYLFGGKSVIHAEDLEERDTAEVLSVYGFSQKELQVQRWRDLLKRAIIKVGSNVCYVLLGVENQSEIQYAMPVKDMIYAALNYGSQVNAAAKKHRKAKDIVTSAEFLSGFTKEDKLIPVITLTVFWGPGKWDGPMGLHDMLVPVEPSLLPFIQDFRINLLVPEDISDFRKFKTSLGPVLEVVKASGDKQEMDAVIRNDPAFQDLENDAVTTINVVASVDIKVNEGGRRTNMCKAWEDQWLDGKQAGMQEGMQKGMKKGMKKGIQKGMQKGRLEEKREGLLSYMQDCLESEVEKDTIITKSMKIFKVSKEEAEKYFEECTLQTV